MPSMSNHENVPGVGGGNPSVGLLVDREVCVGLQVHLASTPMIRHQLDL